MGAFYEENMAILFLLEYIVSTSMMVGWVELRWSCQTLVIDSHGSERHDLEEEEEAITSSSHIRLIRWTQPVSRNRSRNTNESQ